MNPLSLLSRACMLGILLLSCAFAQDIVLTGVVSDTDGSPIVGATVLERGSKNGVFTDATGAYSLSCASKGTIIVAFFGKATQEIAVNGQTSINVTLADESFELNGVEIVGLRNHNRSATDAPVPIDVIPIELVTSTVGQLDLNQLLQFVAPSFNSNRQSGSDGADHIDPATLRGLGPDQTLVLINGKRRHQSSLVNLYGTRGRGNTGTDLNSIPAAAIERIEILRDGAAAQYGSDAIAGVINIVLKSNTDEFTGNMNTGISTPGSAYGPADGKNFNANANYGFKVGKEGFINVSTDYLQRGHTQRILKDSADLVYRSRFGDAEVQNLSTFVNARMPLANGAEAYAFGGYSNRRGDAYAWSRSAGSARNITEISGLTH